MSWFSRDRLEAELELRDSREYLPKAQIADLEAKLAELQNVHGRCRRVMTPGERKVLDAMVAIPTAALLQCRSYALEDWARALWDAELARRDEKP